jgi:hypothetical protein
MEKNARTQNTMQTDTAVPPSYSLSVIEAARRVALITDTGADRCDMQDLDLLESVGLMAQNVTEVDTDTHVVGDTLWVFTQEGTDLTDVLLGTH